MATEKKSAVENLRTSLKDPDAPWTEEFFLIASALVEVADTAAQALENTQTIMSGLR